MSTMPTMLRKLSSAELKENMRFSAPVFFDDGVYMLVDEGVPIHKRDLDALARWNIPFVITMGEELPESKELERANEAASDPVSTTPLPSISEFDKFKKFDWSEEAPPDSHSQASPAPAAASEASKPDKDKVSERRKTLQEAFPDGKIDYFPVSLTNSPQYNAYKALVASLDEVFASIKNSSAVNSRAVDKIVSDLYLLVKDDSAQAVRYIFSNDIADKEMAKSAVNTAIVSLIVAESLRVADTMIERIIAGALLHDAGMLRMPDEIVSKAGKLSDSEFEIIHSHPSYGYKIIVDELAYPEEVGLVAAQHHERWDGTGYPAGLSGDNISLQARIISASDAFVAMVSQRSYRPKFSGYEAMKNLVADNARRYDPDIVKAMIQNIGIYPVGSIVLLNNSAVAQVIQVFPGVPLRPIIRILANEFGQVFSDNKSETVDLRANKNLFIVRAISPAEISAAKDTSSLR